MMYRAGSGDATVLPDLARLAVDRTQGAVLRASAVEFIARMLHRRPGASGGANVQSQTSFGARRPPDRRAAGPGFAERRHARPGQLP